MSLLIDGFYVYPDRWNSQIRLYPHDRFLNAVLLRFFPVSVKPNHLTIFRLILVGPVLALIGLQLYFWAMILFLIAGLSDALDGSLARTRKEISDWGIIWDPLADKILVGTVVAWVAIHLINPYLGLALVAMEFFVLLCGWRQVKRGFIQPANLWGKIKMIFEVIGLTLLLLAAWLEIDMLINLSVQTLVLALVAAVVSVLVRIK